MASQNNVADFTGEVVNTTPHDVVVYDSAGKNIIRTYPCDKSAQIRAIARPFEELGFAQGDIPLIAYPTFESAEIPQNIKNLKNPPALIVSSIVAPLVAGVYDGPVLVPATDPKFVVRGEGGAILGVKALYNYIPESELPSVVPTLA